MVPQVKKLFPTFYGLYAYLSLIAKSNGQKPLDEEVVEAYWLGNRLLETVELENLKKTITADLAKPGLLPKTIAEGKANALSGQVFPHHSFHVLYMNFITKKVEPILQNLDKCLVKWGKILELNGSNLKVETVQLTHKPKFELAHTTCKVNNLFAKEANKGDFVALHWENAIIVLSEKQLENLKFYTQKNIDLLNSFS